MNNPAWVKILTFSMSDYVVHLSNNEYETLKAFFWNSYLSYLENRVWSLNWTNKNQLDYCDMTSKSMSGSNTGKREKCKQLNKLKNIDTYAELTRKIDKYMIVEKLQIFLWLFVSTKSTDYLLIIHLYTTIYTYSITI